MVCGLMIIPSISPSIDAIGYNYIPNSEANPDHFHNTTAYSTSDRTDGWTIGHLLENYGNYRDYTKSPTPAYKGWYKILCVPWITLHWENHGDQKYEFSDSTMTGYLKYRGGGVLSEDSSSNGLTPSVFHCGYNLDVDNDATLEFQFDIEYWLYGKGGYDGNGRILMFVQVAQYPSYGGYDFVHVWPDYSVDLVLHMELCWRIDCDIWSSTSNIVQTYDGSNWNTANVEESHTDYPDNYDPNGNRQVKIRKDDVAKQVSFVMHDDDVRKTDGSYFSILQRHSNQFGGLPTSYDDNEDVSDQDVLVSYVFGYNWLTWPSVGGNADAHIELGNFV
jgi:hypothetical protein